MKAAMIASGGLGGGISSTIAGGNFWDGFRQGIITSGLNHVAHLMTDPGGPDDPKSPSHRGKIKFKDAYKNATGDGNKMYQDITALGLDVKQSDFNSDGWTRIKMDSPSNVAKYGEDALVHGTITLEKVPGSPNYAQVKWNDELGCRCGSYDFEIHSYEGASMRNTFTALAGVLHIRNPSAIFTGGIIYGARPFPIQYTNIIKIK